MELRCLPNFNKRIELWRNTIQLFYSYHRFSLPFAKANLSDFLIEAKLNTPSGKQKNPDIIAWNSKIWLIIDLTFNDHSKADKLDEYKKIEPRELSHLCTSEYPKKIPPETMSSRLSFNNDGNHCQIVVKDIFDVKNEKFISDTTLRNELIKMKGKSLKKLPTLPIALVPEMEGQEIREGIAGFVMQSFNGTAEGKSSYDLCKMGLDKIFDRTPSEKTHSLKERIDREMKLLTGKQDLKGYIEYNKDDQKYRAVEKYRNPRFQTRKYIESKINEWVKSSQQTLKSF